MKKQIILVCALSSLSLHSLVLGSNIRPDMNESEEEMFLFDIEPEEKDTRSLLERLKGRAAQTWQDARFVGAVTRAVVHDKIKTFCANREKDIADLHLSEKLDKAKDFVRLKAQKTSDSDNVKITACAYSICATALAAFVYKKYGSSTCTKVVLLETLPPLFVALMRTFFMTSVEHRYTINCDVSASWAATIENDGSVTFYPLVTKNA